VHDGACLIDLRCVPAVDDDVILEAVRQAQESVAAADAGGGA
jgi:L-seryl-tRNA(Ser) seleniumtransferase